MGGIDLTSLARNKRQKLWDLARAQMDAALPSAPAPVKAAPPKARGGKREDSLSVVRTADWTKKLGSVATPVTASTSFRSTPPSEASIQKALAASGRAQPGALELLDAKLLDFNKRRTSENLSADVTTIVEIRVEARNTIKDGELSVTYDRWASIVVQTATVKAAAPQR